MINPQLLNTVSSYYNNNGYSISEMAKLDYFDKEQYDLGNPKDFDRYIKDIERMVRDSFEYRSMVGYLRYNEGMDTCSFLENVHNRDNSTMKIEIHHAPFTLYDIVYTVINKRTVNNEDMNPFAVAKEVMYLHYCGKVGLIPLSSTVHELVHNSYLFIPLDKVRGCYMEFVNEYRNYLTPELLDMLETSKKMTDNYDNTQMQLFNNHYIYINQDGSYYLPKMDITKNMVNDRIKQIKSNNNLIPMCTRVKKF